MVYKKRIALLLCLLLSLLLSACGEGTEHQKQIYAMNTTFTLTAYGKKGNAGLSAAEDDRC